MLITNGKILKRAATSRTLQEGCALLPVRPRKYPQLSRFLGRDMRRAFEGLALFFATFFYALVRAFQLMRVEAGNRDERVGIAFDRCGRIGQQSTLRPMTRASHAADPIARSQLRSRVGVSRYPVRLRLDLVKQARDGRAIAPDCYKLSSANAFCAQHG